MVFGVSQPVRDLQYQRAKSLTDILLGAGQFYSEVGTVLWRVDTALIRSVVLTRKES